MKVNQILNHDRTRISFEFFPPKDEKGQTALYGAINELAVLKPAYVSVTYGAGGSTRNLTHDLVLRLQKENAFDVVPHLTCVGHTEAEITELIAQYAAAGVQNILALRGDAPKGANNYDHSKDTFPFAINLVEHLADYGGFGIGVAGFPHGHPDTPNRLTEMQHMAEKVNAGADYICSQMFFDNNDYFDYIERARVYGIDVPVVAGLMPITTKKGLQRMAELAGGVRFPATLLRRVWQHQDDPQSLRRIGIDWCASQAEALVAAQIPGIHFYTLNSAAQTLEVCRLAGIKQG